MATYSPVKATTFVASQAHVSAGSVLQDGWIDISGNKWIVDASGNLNCNVTLASPWTDGMLARPTSENTIDSQTKIRMQYSTLGNQGIAVRHNRSTSVPNCYRGRVVGANIYISRTVAGANTDLANVSAAMAPGTLYDLVFKVEQTSSTVTTLTLSLYDVSGNLIATTNTTDNNSNLQNASGSTVLFVITSGGALSATNTAHITQATLYSDYAATCTTLVNDTTFAGPVSSVGANTVLQGGWTDVVGSKFDVNASNFVEGITAPGTPWSAFLVRPSAENAIESRIIGRLNYVTGHGTFLLARHNRSTTVPSAYVASLDVGGVLTISKLVANSYTVLSTKTNAAITTGSYDIQMDTVQTSAYVTSILFQVFNTSGVLLESLLVQDSTSALQSLSGAAGYFATGTASISDFSRLRVYNNIATAYTLTGPGSGFNGVASGVFTVTPNGNSSGITTVTPSDSSGGGTFTPSTVTFASGSSLPATFTYTPGSAGTKTISVTNNNSLTNPGNLSYISTSAVTVSVDNAAMQFSPGNWKGNSGRGGSTWRQTWNVGAWFKCTWTASAAPIATLLMTVGNAATSAQISYILNGVLVDNVQVAGNLSLSGLNASGVNTLVVFVRASDESARWNDGNGTLKVSGLQIDSLSSAGTITANTKWGIVVGDSITEGGLSLVSSNDWIASYSFHLMNALDRAGYDTCINACTGSGYLRTGPGSVPAYYLVSSGTYDATNSRWNKVDSGISLLDSASRLSAYGSTGQEPAFVFVNCGINECRFAMSTSDLQAAVQGFMTSARAAAPSAAIIIHVPAGLYSPLLTSPTNYTNAIKAAFAAYQAAHPTDTKVYLIDFGANMSLTMTGSIMSVDGLHPGVFGGAYISAFLIQAMLAILVPPAAAIARWTHS